MSRVLQIITAAILSVAFVGGFASASSCDNIVIIETGTGSNNTVDCNDVEDITYTCENGVFVLNWNNQNGTSGDATVDFNTTTGAAVTGTVTNDNNQTTDLSTACGPATAPASEGGGSGSVTPQESVAPENVVPGRGQFVPATLPDTDSDSIAPLAIASLASADVVAVVSRAGLLAYRRFSSK